MDPDALIIRFLSATERLEAEASDEAHREYVAARRQLAGFLALHGPTYSLATGRWERYRIDGRGAVRSDLQLKASGRPRGRTLTRYGSLSRWKRPTPHEAHP